MQDFGTKADNSPPPGGQLSAAEFNNLATENETAVLRSGQTLSGASTSQLAQSLFLHGVKAKSFQDSGAANAYVATPVSGTNGVLLPPDYANMGGAIFSFKASNTNSGAATLNIGQTTGTLLGVKPIRTQADTPIPANAIIAGQYIQVAYNPAFDSANGAWELLPWASVTSQPPDFIGLKMNMLVASASGTLTADAITLNTALGGKAYQVNSFSKTINLATVGVGGMDIGAAPVSGYVALYAIFNPSAAISATNPALLATNATLVEAPPVYGGANMPAGYTASALLAVLATNASSQLKICTVRGRKVGIPLGTFFNFAANIPAQSLTIAGFVPLNAKLIWGELSASCTATANISISVNGDNATGQSQQNLSTFVGSTSAVFICNFTSVLMTTPQTVGIGASTTAGTPTFNYYVGGYEI